MKDELVQRVATGSILAVLTIGAVMLLNWVAFTVVLGIIAVAASWEWCVLSRTDNHYAWDIAFLLLICAVILALLIFSSTLPWVLGWSIVWWGIIATLLSVSLFRLNPPQLRARRWHVYGVIVPAIIALSTLHQTANEGRWYVIAFLLIIWTADSSAYFVGKALGRRPLAPMISAGKTVEGVIGGLAGALIMGLILYECIPVASIPSRGYWSLLVVLVVVVSVIGDLYESACKRTAGVKDSGSILPGHGGILDRLDSVFSSSPIFAAGLLYVTK